MRKILAASVILASGAAPALLAVPQIAFILAIVLFGSNGNIGNAFLALAPFLGSVVSFLNTLFSNPFGILILA